MLYGSDYRSLNDQDDARRVRRFRRDVMVVAAKGQEVVAAGLISGLAIVPLLLVVGTALTFLFSLVFSDVAASGPLLGAGVNPAPTPTSRADLLLTVVVATLVVTGAGGATAALRRYDYRRRGGLRRYLHHPRSPIGLLGFFVPVTALTAMALLRKAAESPHQRRAAALVPPPSGLDRAILYTVLGVVAAMLLYLMWEALFSTVLPTLSDLDADAEVARFRREERARVAAEEDALRSRGAGVR